MRGDKEFRKAYELFSSEMLTKQQFGMIAEPLQVRLEQIGEESPKIQATIDVLKSDAFSTEVIESETKGLYDTWQDMNFEEKREIVESLLEKIVIAEGRADYHFVYVPSQKSMPNRQRTAKGSG